VQHELVEEEADAEEDQERARHSIDELQPILIEAVADGGDQL